MKINPIPRKVVIYKKSKLACFSYFVAKLSGYMYLIRYYNSIYIFNKMLISVCKILIYYKYFS